MYDAEHFFTFNNDGFNPFHLACKHNMKFIIMFLLKNKLIQGTELTSNGDSPIHIAIKFNSVDVIKYLITILPSNLLLVTNNQGNINIFFSPIFVILLIFFIY